MRWVVCIVVLAVVGLPSVADAHDDPVVTVRILCNGFNVLDMDAVLGEISDSATLSVDRPVQGLDEIEQWVREQMDADLRIEIVEIGTPRQLADGYTLSWTGRFTRQDWRKAGIQSRQVSNTVVIHNGRITQWTAQPDAGVSPANTASSSPTATAPVSAGSGSSMPELFGIPVSLFFVPLIVIGGATVLLRRIVRS